MSTLFTLHKALKDVFKSYSPAHSSIESLLLFDFKLNNPRENLMRLCFSSLQLSYLILFFLTMTLIIQNPFFSIQNILIKFLGQDNLISFFLLNGQVLNMFYIFFIFFILEYFIKQEVIFIVFLFLLLFQSDVHINLSISGLIAVEVGRTLRQLWLFTSLQSETRKVWFQVNLIQFLTTLMSSLIVLFFLDFLSVQRFFSTSLTENRILFFISSISFIMFVQFFFSAIWGHFYFLIKKEPTDLFSYYSSSHWFGKIKISVKMKNTLLHQISNQLNKYSEHQKEIKLLKDQGLGSQMAGLDLVLNKEVSFLKLALSRLT